MAVAHLSQASALVATPTTGVELNVKAKLPTTSRRKRNYYGVLGWRLLRCLQFNRLYPENLGIGKDEYANKA